MQEVIPFKTTPDLLKLMSNLDTTQESIVEASQKIMKLARDP
jgi:hypothetical protein